MNKLKRTLALMAALAMTATAFVGCGGNESSSTAESKAESSAEESSEAAEGEESSAAEEESSVESAAGYTNVDVPALGEPDGSLKDGGKQLTILCWNDDDLKYMYDIVADATGMDKSMINYKNVGSNGTELTNSTHRYSCLATTLTCTSATLTGTWLIRTTMSTLLRCLQ